jgi:hypothetical protein
MADEFFDELIYISASFTADIIMFYFSSIVLIAGSRENLPFEKIDFLGSTSNVDFQKAHI